MKKNRKTSVTGELVDAKFIRNMDDKDLYSSIEAYKFYHNFVVRLHTGRK